MIHFEERGYINMNIDIRIGTENDIATSHKIMREAFEEYRDLDVPSSAITEPVEKLKTAFNNGTENFIMCFMNGEPQGTSRFHFKEDYLYFSRLSVPPVSRGKGLAKMMLSWLEDYARSNGKLKVQCKVRHELKRNIELYRSIGYQIVKEENVDNPNLVRTVVMEKLV